MRGLLRIDAYDRGEPTVRGAAETAHDTTTAQRVALQLPPTPTAPRVAREAVVAFAHRCSEDLLDQARLILSELVTNSVRHAGLGPSDSILVRLSVADGRLRGSVHDPGEPFGGVGAERAPDPNPGGFGLHIVSTLARDWGIREGHGNEVWFEL